ncbi:MAG: hypothetical protein ABI862_15885 [Ilumatobacteraceae bacterium]
MKKSIIWTTAAVATVGFGVPAVAAMATTGPVRQIAPAPVVTVGSSDDSTSSTAPHTTVSVVSTPAALPTISLPVSTTANSTANSVEDISGNCDEAEHADDAACAGANAPGVTVNSTENNVKDVSGNCDEAEHANDPSCTGTDTAVDDNSGPGSDDSGHNGSDDNSGHDNSGHDN